LGLPKTSSFPPPPVTIASVGLTSAFWRRPSFTPNRPNGPLLTHLRFFSFYRSFPSRQTARTFFVNLQRSDFFSSPSPVLGAFVFFNPLHLPPILPALFTAVSSFNQMTAFCMQVGQPFSFFPPMFVQADFSPHPASPYAPLSGRKSRFPFLRILLLCSRETSGSTTSRPVSIFLFPLPLPNLPFLFLRGFHCQYWAQPSDSTPLIFCRFVSALPTSYPSPRAARTCGRTFKHEQYVLFSPYLSTFAFPCSFMEAAHTPSIFSAQLLDSRTYPFATRPRWAQQIFSPSDEANFLSLRGSDKLTANPFQFLTETRKSLALIC